MTLEDLGNLGEFLGALGVIASLVYLAAQIRQNTRSVRTSAFQQATRDVTEVIDHLARDPELSRIWSAGIHDFESLPREERRRFAYYMTGLLRRYENLLYQTQHGTLDADAWQGAQENLRNTFSHPGVITWWKRARQLFNRQLQDFIEQDIL